jgi:hypothetical protein
MNENQQNDSQKDNILILKIMFKIMHAVYIIFSLISLTYSSYTYTKQQCEYSNLWLYVATPFFINDFISDYKSKAFDLKYVKNELLFKLYSIYIILYFIWGIAELNISCINKLYETWLYTMSFIGCVFYGILTFVNIAKYVFNLHLHNKEKEEEENNKEKTNEKIKLPPFLEDIIYSYIPKPIKKNTNESKI